MKSFKILAMGTMALAAASMATAATQYVKITGSSAFRGATTIAVYNLLDGTQTISGGVAESGKKVTNGTHTILKGKLASAPTGDTYVIQMFWTGSAGGVMNVANDYQVAFPSTATTAWLADNAANLVTVTKTGSGSGQDITTSAVISSPVWDGASRADIAMSDTKQATTIYTIDAGFNDLQEAQVGVVPFVWVRSGSADSALATQLTGFTNINTLQAQQVLTATGGTPLSQFTGLAADNNAKVFVLGRDGDSGTRLVTFAESGFGTLSNPYQVITTPTGSTTGNVTAISAYASQTINGITYAAGNGGYSSGGTLATDLNRNVSGFTVGGKKVALVGYLGTSDAAAVTNGKVLGWNGVTLPFNSAGGLTDGKWDYTAVRNGSYTFWSYEYLMRSASIGVFQDAFATALASQIAGADAVVSGVISTSMAVSRNAEGAVIY